MHTNGCRRFSVVTLEMSLKPFRRLDEPFMRGVCRELFAQWEALLRQAEGIAVLLWTADGSEILEYTGDLDAPFEWACQLGTANPKAPAPNGPNGLSIHCRSYPYMESPPAFTYRDLKRVVSLLKEEGQARLGKPVRVGATFDPGPEFARSDFKYVRHPEICLAQTMGSCNHGFVTCYATLKGENRAYAGFPEGIPEGTSLGAFLGRQSRHFLGDLGFDYLWLSNGFGFGLETWRVWGPHFDPTGFHPEGAAQTAERILGFWRDFRRECPGFGLETRGTNLLTGTDLATDATPLLDIYEGGFDMAPPPNSPWAAIDGNFGLELAGYLSRIADVPSEKAGFPFRFYTHDPWWLNSPWLDRYGREPHDIYLPLAVARLTRAGTTQSASSVSFLTADDSYGRMPVEVPNEVIPHILRAAADAPDAPGPLVWVYPLRTYHRQALRDGRPDLPFFGDWFVCGAINGGLPLNTVAEETIFASTFAANSALYCESILFLPVPEAGSPLTAALLAHVEQGGRALLYGPAANADPALRRALNLQPAEPLDGAFDLSLPGFPEASAHPARLRHLAVYCGGGMAETVADPGDPATRILATASAGGASRAAALVRRIGASGGLLAWIRGTTSIDCPPGCMLPAYDPADTWFPGPLLARLTLAALGIDIGVQKRNDQQRIPLQTVSRHANAFFFSGYSPNDTVSLKLRFPAGAPLWIGCETDLHEGHSVYRPPTAWHRECRVFIDGQREGLAKCTEVYPGMVGVRRRLLVTGLDHAVLRFYPVTGTSPTLLANPSHPYLQGDFREWTPVPDIPGHCLEAHDLSGAVLISW